MSDTDHCVIVGASHAGAQVALNLSKAGWAGAITLLGEEPHLPYHRPPLSKDFLAGGKTLDQLHLRPQQHYDNAGVTLRLGERVIAVNRDSHTVTLASGASLAYDKLVFATGARVRRLPIDGESLPGVRYLRSAADIAAIQRELDEVKNVVVIGGGYIGLEAAATMRKLGRDVTVVEAADRVLQRVTSPTMSRFFTRVHEEEGVRIIVDTGVTRFTGTDRLAGVELASGEIVAAELAIVGIGVIPNVELAADAGLACSNGIDVDEYGATADPDVYACGDCAHGTNRLFASPLRLESVQNANDQGLCVAKAIAGDRKPYAAVPWFWSDQYDVKLQIAGLSQGYTSTQLRGDPDAGRSFALFYLDGDRLLAVDAINRPREFVAARQLLAADAAFDARKLADESIPLKECRR